MRTSNLGLNSKPPDIPQTHKPELINKKTNQIFPLDTRPASTQYYTFYQIICSRFMAIQVISAIILSFLVPFGLFSLIFIPMGVIGTRSAQSLSVIIMSPWLCGVFSPLLIPLSLPEATRKNLIGPIHTSNFHHQNMLKYGIVRHLILGTGAAIIWIPIGLVISFSLQASINALYFVVYACMYISFISGSIIPFSILGFCMYPNYIRTISLMSMHPVMWKRLFYRMIKCPLC